MTTKPITVAVHGAAGRVGREVLRAVAGAPDLRLVAAIDRVPPADLVPLGVDAPYYTNARDAFLAAKPDVVVDFSNAAATIALVPIALAARVRPVIGTTGLGQQQVEYIDALCQEHRLGAFLAPNFTIGAVLLAKLAAIAARYFDYVDIVEQHHEQKIDAPSGTALAIAKAIRDAKGADFARNVPEREPLAGSRGANHGGITVHATRMPGRLAHHEVTFGGLGQTLTLRHDTINRECYMPGVLLAIRKVGGLHGLTIGLDKLLDV